MECGSSQIAGTAIGREEAHTSDPNPCLRFSNHLIDILGSTQEEHYRRSCIYRLSLDTLIHQYPWDMELSLSSVMLVSENFSISPTQQLVSNRPPDPSLTR